MKKLLLVAGVVLLLWAARDKDALPPAPLPPAPAPWPNPPPPPPDPKPPRP